MRFNDRLAAGRTLAMGLEEYDRGNAVVVGLACGGVMVGRGLADALRLPLDVVMVREFYAPGPNPTEPIGAVAAFSRPALSDGALRRVLLPPGYLDQTVREHRILAEIHEDDIRDRSLRKPLARRVVILVDDGNSTELAWRAALKRVRGEGPQAVLAAAPFLAVSIADVLRPLVDHVEVLELLPEVSTTAGHYERFPVLREEDMRTLITHQTYG